MKKQNEYKSPKSALIIMAAKMVRCDVLRELDEICETKKSISTSKLRIILDAMSEDLKKDAIFLKNINSRVSDK